MRAGFASRLLPTGSPPSPGGASTPIPPPCTAPWPGSAWCRTGDAPSTRSARCASSRGAWRRSRARSRNWSAPRSSGSTPAPRGSPRRTRRSGTRSIAQRVSQRFPPSARRACAIRPASSPAPCGASIGRAPWACGGPVGRRIGVPRRVAAVRRPNGTARWAPYSTFALARRSSWYFCRRCCCSCCVTWGFTSATGGSWDERTSSTRITW